MVFASIGAFIAIAGDTWDSKELHIYKRLTGPGRIALVCIVLSVLFGVTKEIRIKSSEAESAQKNERLSALLEATEGELKNNRNSLSSLKEANRRLQLDNDFLKEKMVTVQNHLTRRERVDKISFHVDAFNTEERRGYNSLSCLVEHLYPEIDVENNAIGIYFILDYGELELYVAGVSKGDREKWLYRLFFHGEDKHDYYGTKPRGILKDTPFLIAGNLSQEDFQHFWKVRPLVSKVISRPEYPHYLFDPTFELGVIKIIGFGLLDQSVDVQEFAVQKSAHWFNKDLKIPRNFLKGWHVVLSINDRQIREVEKFIKRQPTRTEAERLASWDIMSKYQPKDNEALIAPVGRQWTDYFPLMNENLRELLYGKRDGYINIEDKPLPPSR